MSQIIDTIMSNPVMMIITAILSIFIVITLVKKIFKILFYLIIIFIAFLAYVHFTGGDVDEVIKQTKDKVTSAYSSDFRSIEFN